MQMKRTPVFLAVGLALGVTACETPWSNGGRTLVQVVAAHHGTVDDEGDYTDNGRGSSRNFPSDEGWRINLTTGYISISGLTLHDCDGNVAEVPLYRGSVAEDLIYADDLERTAVGSITVPPVSLCQMTVHYGPFDPDESENVPRTSAIEGNTVYLEGSAVISGDDSSRKEFKIRVREELDVEIDMSEMNDGGPMKVSGREDFPIELVVLKTYDRFFDGLDFASASTSDLEDNVAAVLELETTLKVER